MRARWVTMVTAVAIVLFCLSFGYSFYRAAAFLGRTQGEVTGEPAAQREADRLGPAAPGAQGGKPDSPPGPARGGVDSGRTGGPIGGSHAVPVDRDVKAVPQDAKRTEDSGKQVTNLSGADLYLGITGGFVTVFDGLPGAGGRVLEITEIRADSLPPPEVQDLIRGIRVSGREELLMILEGLGSEGERE